MTTDNTERTRTEVCPCGVSPLSVCPWCDTPAAPAAVTTNPDGSITISTRWMRRNSSDARTVGPADPLTSSQRDVVLELVHQLYMQRVSLDNARAAVGDLPLLQQERADAEDARAAATAVAALLGIVL